MSALIGRGRGGNIPKDRSLPNQGRGPHSAAPVNRGVPSVGSKPVALQPFTTYDRAHDFNASGGFDHLKMLKYNVFLA
jgi:hypothetical protein